MTRLKVGVLGAGTIGCYLGGRLLSAGHNVVFVGRARAKAELERAGLSLTNLAGASVEVPPERIAFETDVGALAGSSIALCCVKSGQTAEAARALGGVLSRDALVVSMQNGLRNAETLRAHANELTVAGAVVGFNVVPKGPGAFRQTTAGAVLLEAARSHLAGELAAALDAAGVEARTVSEIRAHQWAKLVMNLNNAVSALSGAPSRDLVVVPGYRRVVAAIVAEAVTVMSAAGIRPARLRGIPVALLPRLLKLPTPLVRLVMRAQLRIDPDARSSMWEDFERGRSTEVDDLNGEIVRLADASGTTAPVNRRIVDLVHDAERAGLGSPKLAPDALWRAITSG